jgi:enamine deaminase RidA (YjgF/YER057c/UK114 family)
MVVPPAGSRIAIVGGQHAVDKDGKIVGKDDLAKQTEQALKNLVTCLEAANASVADLRGGSP